jgi:hypothetical protein
MKAMFQKHEIIFREMKNILLLILHCDLRSEFSQNFSMHFSFIRNLPNYVLNFGYIENEIALIHNLSLLNNFSFTKSASITPPLKM